MSKSATKRSPATTASTVAGAKPSHQAKEADSGSKQSRVIAMLQSPAMMKATGWQPHSVRGFLAGVVRKRLKFETHLEENRRRAGLSDHAR